MRKTTVALTIAMIGGLPVAWSGSAGAQPGALTCNGVQVTLLGTVDDDEIVGTIGDDVIIGGLGDDVIDGGGGDDIVCAGPGDDTVSGGAGADVVLAGAGDDTVAGGAGRDLLAGGPGADAIRGQNAVDSIAGGPGRDLLAGGNGWDNCTIGPGTDTRVRCERLIVAETADLVGVAFETPAARAIARLTAILGPPTVDDGWTTGCPLDGDEVTLDSRLIAWGSLRASFVGAPGERIFLGWSYPTFGSSLPGGPGVGEVVLPGGFSIGDPIGEAADALDATLESGAPFSGLRFTVDELVEISTQGDSDTDVIDTVFVGPYEVCE